MHPCQQGVNLVQTFLAQGDGFLKIQVAWKAPVCLPGVWEKLLPSAKAGFSLGNWRERWHLWHGCWVMLKHLCGCPQDGGRRVSNQYQHSLPVLGSGGKGAGSFLRTH